MTGNGIRIAVVIAAAAALGPFASSAGAGVGGAGGGDYLGPKGGGDSWVPSRAKRSSIVWAVGDGATYTPEAVGVAAMIGSHRIDRFLYLGDVYETGSANGFQISYRGVYGSFDPIAAPTIGNHEYAKREIGYLPYWSAARGAPAPLRYAFIVSGWQLISLNSNEPNDPAQLAWLRRTLRRTRAVGSCRLAFMHHPRFSASSAHGEHETVAAGPLWAELVGRARLMLAGHDHNMQRYRPVKGTSVYIAGSGGRNHTPIDLSHPYLRFGDDAHFGALQIKLRPGRAVLRYFSAEGAVLDRSEVSCDQDGKP
jgi:acid phosphatase type 7